MQEEKIFLTNILVLLRRTELRFLRLDFSMFFFFSFSHEAPDPDMTADSSGPAHLMFHGSVLASAGPLQW